MPALPGHPVTRDQQYLHGVCDRLDTMADLLGQVLNRLPPSAERGGDVVELREPASPLASAADGGESPAQADTPVPRPSRRRKTTANTKEEGA